MSDLISRKEVAEILNHQRFGIAQISWDIISEKIKALPPVEPQEWISVKDRLPEKNDCYLVTFNFESNGNPDNGIGVVEFYNGNFYSNGFGVNKNVVAWYSNPVPSPYKRKEE